MSKRQAVFPTRMAMTTFKGKQVGAQKGYELLKKKSDALTAKLRGLLRDIKASKADTASQMSGASFAIAEAVWAAGDFRPRVRDAPAMRASVRVKVKFENVAGVKVPSYTVVRSGGSDVELEMLGLSGGGRQIASARDKFAALLDGLVRVCSLTRAFTTLDAAIKLTNRRVNALDNVVIPSIVDTIAYITSELDELEKEEFFRLKKVLKVKERDRAAAAREEAEALKAAAEASERAHPDQYTHAHTHTHATPAPAPAAAAVPAASTPLRADPHVPARTPAAVASTPSAPLPASPASTPGDAHTHTHTHTPAPTTATRQANPASTPSAPAAYVMPSPAPAPSPAPPVVASPAPAPAPAVAHTHTHAYATPVRAEAPAETALDPFAALEETSIAPAPSHATPAAPVGATDAYDPYASTFGAPPAAADPFDDAFGADGTTGFASTPATAAPAAAASTPFDAFDDDVVV